MSRDDVIRGKVQFDLDAFERRLGRQQVIAWNDVATLIAVLRDVHAQLVQAEAAATHFYHCRQCTEDGEPCPEGWAYVVALGLTGESESDPS